MADTLDELSDDPRRDDRRVIRQQFLTDIDAYAEQAGGRSAFHTTVPDGELQRLVQRGERVWQEGVEFGTDGLAILDSYGSTVRVAQAAGRLLDEVRARTILGREVDPLSRIAPELDADELYRVQVALSERAGHYRDLLDAGIEAPDVSYIEALVDAEEHLVALQHQAIVTGAQVLSDPHVRHSYGEILLEHLAAQIIADGPSSIALDDTARAALASQLHSLSAYDAEALTQVVNTYDPRRYIETDDRAEVWNHDPADWTAANAEVLDAVNSLNHTDRTVDRSPELRAARRASRARALEGLDRSVAFAGETPAALYAETPLEDLRRLRGRVFDGFVDGVAVAGDPAEDFRESQWLHQRIREIEGHVSTRELLDRGALMEDVFWRILDEDLASHQERVDAHITAMKATNDAPGIDRDEAVSRAEQIMMREDALLALQLEAFDRERTPAFASEHTKGIYGEAIFNRIVGDQARLGAGSEEAGSRLTNIDRLPVYDREALQVTADIRRSRDAAVEVRDAGEAIRQDVPVEQYHRIADLVAAGVERTNGRERDASDIYTRTDLAQLSGQQVANGLLEAGLDESIATRLSNEQLQGVWEWSNEQAWMAGREYEPRRAEEWGWISEFAQGELDARGQIVHDHEQIANALTGKRDQASSPTVARDPQLSNLTTEQAAARLRADGLDLELVAATFTADELSAIRDYADTQAQQNEMWAEQSSLWEDYEGGSDRYRVTSGEWYDLAFTLSEHLYATGYDDELSLEESELTLDGAIERARTENATAFGAEPATAAASATPARDAYLDARACAGAAGAQLADPKTQLALNLNKLQQDASAVMGRIYHSEPRPNVMRRSARREWDQQAATETQALEGYEHDIELHRRELGPNADAAITDALNLQSVREQLVQEALELHGQAVREEVSRDPVWLQETLGARPDTGRETARWDKLAGELASHRLRFHVVDELDNGIRSNDVALADKVTEYRASLGLQLSQQISTDLGQGI